MSKKKPAEMVVEVVESAGEMDAEVTPSMLPDEPEVESVAAAKGELIVVPEVLETEAPAARPIPEIIAHLAAQFEGGGTAVYRDGTWVVTGQGHVPTGWLASYGLELVSEALGEVVVREKPAFVAI